MRAKTLIKKVPLVSDLAIWASWIVRVRQIARMAFATDAAIATMQSRIDNIEHRVADLALLQRALSNENASLGRQIVALRQQIASAQNVTGRTTRK